MITKENLVPTNPKRYNHKAQNSDNKPKISNPYTLKKKGTCYVCGKLGHQAPLCKKRVQIGNNGNSSKANLVEGDDIIADVVSQANMSTLVTLTLLKFWEKAKSC